MNVDPTHTENNDDFMYEVCVDLFVPAPTNNRDYYWGFLAKPEEPIKETNWDGLQFYTRWTSAGWATNAITMSDSWIATSNPSIPDTNTSGAKSDFVNHDTTNDYTMDTNKTKVQCAGASTDCTFTGCAIRKFKTEDAQDWQVNPGYEQKFQAVTYFTTY